MCTAERDKSYIDEMILTLRQSRAEAKRFAEERQTLLFKASDLVNITKTDGHTYLRSGCFTNSDRHTSSRPHEQGELNGK